MSNMVAPVPAVVVDVVDCWVNSTTGVSPFLSSIRHLLDHERANEQSHATGVRLNANHGQTESEGKKDLIQAKQNSETDSSRQF